MGMEIAYLGHSSFRLKGKAATIVTDPYDEKVGKYPRDIDANIVTVSHSHFDHNAVTRVNGNPFVINSPGEYEVGGISVIGVPTYHDEKEGGERGVNTIYVLELDGLRIAHLGDLGHKLSQSQLEEMGGIDIALIPVGGVYTIDAKIAVEVMKQIDPWIAIPMHYKQEGLSVEGLAEVKEFLSETGKTDVVPVNKFSITADKLPDALQVVVLEKK